MTRQLCTPVIDTAAYGAQLKGPGSWQCRFAAQIFTNWKP
jgi:hypothetical protein